MKFAHIFVASSALLSLFLEVVDAQADAYIQPTPPAGLSWSQLNGGPIPLPDTPSAKANPVVNRDIFDKLPGIYQATDDEWGCCRICDAESNDPSNQVLYRDRRTCSRCCPVCPFLPNPYKDDAARATMTRLGGFASYFIPKPAFTAHDAAMQAMQKQIAAMQNQIDEAEKQEEQMRGNPEEEDGAEEEDDVEEEDGVKHRAPEWLVSYRERLKAELSKHNKMLAKMMDHSMTTTDATAYESELANFQPPSLEVDKPESFLEVQTSLRTRHKAQAKAQALAHVVQLFGVPSLSSASGAMKMGSSMPGAPGVPGAPSGSPSALGQTSPAAGPLKLSSPIDAGVGYNMAKTDSRLFYKPVPDYPVLPPCCNTCKGMNQRWGFLKPPRPSFSRRRKPPPTDETYRTTMHRAWDRFGWDGKMGPSLLEVQSEQNVLGMLSSATSSVGAAAGAGASAPGSVQPLNPFATPPPSLTPVMLPQAQAGCCYMCVDGDPIINRFRVEQRRRRDGVVPPRPIIPYQ